MIKPLYVLIGLSMLLVSGYTLFSGGCTPADRQQAAGTLAPVVGAVICQQVTTDQNGRQICQITADTLGKLAPLLRLSQQNCPVETGGIALASASAAIPPAPVASQAAGGGHP
jgi:hypothetical protein